jgi:type IX secretion system PorP/SprF family membrane protein
MKTRNLYIIILLLFTINLIGQDAQFSQFYNTPTTFNPAETGHRTTGGKYRLNAIHRNQWSALGSGFNTTTLAFDNNIDYGDKSYLGVGLAFINDESPSGGFKTMTILGGLAAHMCLDRKSKHFLSIGVQFGVVNNQVRIEKLQFENDILGGESENFTNTNTFNIDNRIGFLYSFFPKEETQIKIGFGINHLITYENKFINSFSATQRQYSASFDLAQEIGEKWNVNPHILFLQQGTFQQNLIGCIAKYELVKERNLIFGTSYRTSNLLSFNQIRSNDAIIAILGFGFRGASQIIVSYDINISPLMAATNGRGSLEIGLQYIIDSSKNKRKVSPGELFNLGD